MESKDNLGVNCTYTGDSIRNNSDPLISVNEGFVNGFIISEVREMRQELVSIAYNTRVITRKDQEDILYNIIEESIRKIRRKQDSARLELAQLVHLLSIDRREIFKLSRLSESVIFEKGALEPCRL